MSAPDPSGAGAEAAMRGALADAGLAPDAIDYLNLHGTGTPLNDKMECLAVERVFGSALPVSSTKPLVGHTLGAAGAIEAAFCWLVLDRCEAGALVAAAALRGTARGIRSCRRCTSCGRARPRRAGGAARDDELVRLRRQQLHARARARPVSANGAALRTARVLRWSAWAPGIETPEAWRAWCDAPVPLATTGHPEARFLPAMLRRRCSPLTRIALTAAWGCVEEGELGGVRTVFASRHGSVNESIEMIEQVVRRERLSPATVQPHRAQRAGGPVLHRRAEPRRRRARSRPRETPSRAAGSRCSRTSSANPTAPCCYVMADVQLAPRFAALVDEPEASYAVALLVARDGDGPELRFDVAGSSRRRSRRGRTRACSCAGCSPSDERLSLGRFHWTRCCAVATRGIGRVDVIAERRRHAFRSHAVGLAKSFGSDASAPTARPSSRTARARRRPGGVAAEQMNRRGFGVEYGIEPRHGAVEELERVGDAARDRAAHVVRVVALEPGRCSSRGARGCGRESPARSARSAPRSRRSCRRSSRAARDSRRSPCAGPRARASRRSRSAGRRSGTAARGGGRGTCRAPTRRSPRACRPRAPSTPRGTRDRATGSVRRAPSRA